MMRMLLTADRLSNSDKFEILQEIGEVLTTWRLYGPRHRYSRTIIAAPIMTSMTYCRKDITTRKRAPS